MERPSPHSSSDLTIHRATNIHDKYPLRHEFDFHYGDEALDCVQTVEEVWQELGTAGLSAGNSGRRCVIPTPATVRKAEGDWKWH